MFRRKTIWHRNEIPIGDYLMSFQDKLREEFMEGFSSLEQAALALGHTTLDRPDHNVGKNTYDNLVQEKTDRWRPNAEGWKNVPFKYTLKDANNNIERGAKDGDFIVQKCPTAFSIMQEYGDDCPIMNYSILAPKSAILRHTGPENRSGRFIRIHIPLIVPEGDVFLEVDGEEVTWKDLFGFNNQYSHSAYNLTDEWRLIFLIDIDRERAGLPPGEPYNPRYIPKPFMRRVLQ
jgi:hypothetical protein